MQAEILEAGISRRDRCARVSRRIGSHPRDTPFTQRAIDGRPEPRRVARFAGHRPGMQPHQPIEERQRRRWCIGEAGRQLQQQATQFHFQFVDLAQEDAQRRFAVVQASLVADGARHLHRKAERCRHAGRPATVGGRPMRAVERGIDLDTIEPLRVSLEVAVALGEAARQRGRNRPAGDANTHFDHGNPAEAIHRGRRYRAVRHVTMKAVISMAAMRPRCRAAVAASTRSGSFVLEGE